MFATLVFSATYAFPGMKGVDLGWKWRKATQNHVPPPATGRRRTIKYAV